MNFLTLSGIVKAIKAKKISCREVVDFYLKQIEKHNPALNAFLRLNEKGLKNLDSLKPEGPLAGVPLGIKDIFCTKGLKTTAASKMLSDYTPPYSATVVERLEQAGAFILGKCNNDEFAMGSTGESSYFGATKNPWNLDCVAGGSSSGSASAVASHLCPGALGTDTGGSIRLPAHYCNLVGIKPTYGRVSRYGMIAYASSLDQAGPLTHTVEDGALILDAITGYDSKDSTTADLPPTQLHKQMNSQVKGMKVAYLRIPDGDGSIDLDIVESQEKVLKALKARGCELTEIKWPFLDYGVSVYYLISTSEASSNLSRYDGVRYGFRSKKPAKDLKDFYSSNRSEGFGLEVKRRILMGTFCLSTGYYDEYFHKACQVRYLIKQDFEKIFKTCDAILCPVSTNTAPKIKKTVNVLKNYLNDQFTVFANLAGLPALSLPVHFSKQGLPIGAQLIGPAFKEQNILNIALALEEEFQLYKKRANGI